MGWEGEKPHLRSVDLSSWLVNWFLVALLLFQHEE
jgi:hypothetical protein